MLTWLSETPIFLIVHVPSSNAMIIGSYRTPALEHHLSVQCVVRDPGQDPHHRLPLRQGRMNRSPHQIEDENRTGFSGGGY